MPDLDPSFSLVAPLVIFVARFVDVSLGTVRIALVSRGLRRIAPVVGFLEILVWLVALGQVVLHLDRPLSYLAYAGGYAAGTWAGLVLEEWLAFGFCAVQIITRRNATDLSQMLADLDVGLTSVAARGLHGNVRLLYSVIRRKELRTVLARIQELHPQAFVTATDVRLAKEGYLPSEPSGGRRLFELFAKK